MKLRLILLRHAASVSALLIFGCADTANVRPRVPSAPPVADQTIAADFQKSRHLAKSRPLDSLGPSLDAARRIQNAILRGDRSRPTLEAYNHAVARVVEAVDAARINPWSAPVPIANGSTSWQLKARLSRPRPGLDPLKFRMIPTDTVTIGGTYFQKQVKVDGIGAPIAIVARTNTSNSLIHDLTDSSVYGSATATVSFRGNTAELLIHERLSEDTTTLDGQTFTLSADFSTPLAMMIDHGQVEKLGLVRLISPQRYADTTRLTELQIYDPERIPVLLVHGLDSTPATWTPLINALRADPDLRKRYQFWVFSYPSGYPYPYSASLLRRQLDEMETRHPGHKPMVLIGHSMGGMISRLMLTDSEDKIWRSFFATPPSQTHISGMHRQLLEEALVFRHRSSISRTIFISTPHRGSDIATSSFGRLFSRLVRVPDFLADTRNAVFSLITLDATALTLERAPSSIDTLAPNNRFVLAVNKLPPYPGAVFHTIAGDRGKGGNKDHTKPVMSDGVVPYWSAHLDGAASEKIVPSHHSAHQNPDGIAEVHRLLRLHARLPVQGKTSSNAVRKVAADSAPAVSENP